MYIQLYKCIDKHHISLHAGLQFNSNSASWRRYSIFLTLSHDTSQLPYVCKHKNNCSTLVWIRCRTWQAWGTYMLSFSQFNYVLPVAVSLAASPSYFAECKLLHRWHGPLGWTKKLLEFLSMQYVPTGVEGCDNGRPSSLRKMYIMSYCTDSYRWLTISLACPRSCAQVALPQGFWLQAYHFALAFFWQCDFSFFFPSFLNNCQACIVGSYGDWTVNSVPQPTCSDTWATASLSLRPWLLPS